MSYITGLTPWAFYSEWEPYAAEWLRNLIRAGLIPRGHVDERSISDIQPEDLNGFTQFHAFAGIGGWPCALRQARWPDDKPVWTGSCPCQSFSVAGKGLGTADERHLWPDFLRLIRAACPEICMGEQVAGSLGYGWLDGVVADLEAEDYACRYVDIPACSVNSPQRRNRLYWLAYPQQSDRRSKHQVNYETYRRNGSGRSSTDSKLADPRLPRLAGRTSLRQDPRQECETVERGSGSSGSNDERVGQSYQDRLATRSKGVTSTRQGNSVDAASGEFGERMGDPRRLSRADDRRSDPMGGPPSPHQSREEERQRNGNSFSNAGENGDSPNYWHSSALIGPDRDGRYRRIKSRVAGVVAWIPRLLAPSRADRGADELTETPVVTEPISPLAPRTPMTASQLSAYGNAICVPLAAEVIRAWMDVEATILAPTSPRK